MIGRRCEFRDVSGKLCLVSTRVKSLVMQRIGEENLSITVDVTILESLRIRVW